MKKYAFLTFHKDYHLFIEELRNLSVVHIVEKQQGFPEEESELFGWTNYGKRLKAVIKSLDIIKEDHDIKDLKPANLHVEGIQKLEEVENLFVERDQALHQRSATQKELERIAPWGDFQLEKLKKLEKAGLYIHFHTVSQSKFDENWVEEYNAIRINKAGSFIYFVTVTKESKFPDIEAEHVKPFEYSFSSLKAELDETDKNIRLLDERLQTIIREDFNTLLHTEKEINDHINWEKVLLNSESQAEDKLVLLEGYVPEANVQAVNEALEKRDVYFESSDVKPEDNPPVLLKNNRFARLFEVISNLYDRPSYHGFDLTAFYAPFYVIFFGLCVGDCGYGLVYVILSFFLRKAKGDFLKSASNLVLCLGIGTIIFGFISGTFFGVLISDQPWTWIDHFRGIILDSNQMFYFALILGVIQLTYAWIIKIITTIMRFGFVYTLDTLGWMIALWGNVAVYFLGSKGMISSSFQTVLFYIVNILGFSMMLFFNNPKKGIKGVPGSIGSGLWGLYNKLTGLLGDILSYIRLFALGISGAVLGLVFNQLAFSFAPDIIVLKQLVIVLILLFGHSINLFLCSLSGFVHPMRLTFVEFYNNAGFEGGGKPYNPFRKETKSY
ncbi:MAG: V-type ATP synthase subunit I [Bacteroidales bacterium]|nr:V-type ATP synthase subunit I [Bacteroidales bacterium]